SQKTAQVSSDGRYVKVGNKYYNLGTGLEATTAANIQNAQNATYQSMSIAAVTSGMSTGVVTVANSGQGNNNYVVDETLQGGTLGPNYLQDCIRYGKYLIQQGSKNSDTGEFEWHDLSWESSGSIHDYNYTEDDAAAQAKYDRLQSQIQSEDKKLELELNNIETQRSAVTTEIESVQKVIDDNIESSFKIFS
ncbi:hypothetical protein IJ670_07815, partial [bacterium]|nr:hypothetical protein [bacterium]